MNKSLGLLGIGLLGIAGIAGADQVVQPPPGGSPNGIFTVLGPCGGYLSDLKMNNRAPYAKAKNGVLPARNPIGLSGRCSDSGHPVELTVRNRPQGSGSATQITQAQVLCTAGTFRFLPITLPDATDQSNFEFTLNHRCGQLFSSVLWDKSASVRLQPESGAQVPGWLEARGACSDSGDFVRLTAQSEPPISSDVRCNNRAFSRSLDLRSLEPHATYTLQATHTDELGNSAQNSVVYTRQQPTLTVTEPLAGAEVGVRFEARGMCSEPGGMVRARVGSEVVQLRCDDQRYTFLGRYHSIDISTLIPPGAQFDLTVEHDDDGPRRFAAAPVRLSLRREPIRIAWSAPQAGAEVDASTWFRGTCNLEGRNVRVRARRAGQSTIVFERNVSCEQGQFTFSQSDWESFAVGAQIQLEARLADAQGYSAQAPLSVVRATPRPHLFVASPLPNQRTQGEPPLYVTCTAGLQVTVSEAGQTLFVGTCPAGGLLHTTVALSDRDNFALEGLSTPKTLVLSSTNEFGRTTEISHPLLLSICPKRFAANLNGGVFASRADGTPDDLGAYCRVPNFTDLSTSGVFTFNHYQNDASPPRMHDTPWKLADPSIKAITHSNGERWYYVTGTYDSVGAANISIFRSKDLVSWTHHMDAFDERERRIEGPGIRYGLNEHGLEGTDRCFLDGAERTNCYCAQGEHCYRTLKFPGRPGWADGRKLCGLWDASLQERAGRVWVTFTATEDRGQGYCDSQTATYTSRSMDATHYLQTVMIASIEKSEFENPTPSTRRFAEENLAEPIYFNYDTASGPSYKGGKDLPSGKRVPSSVALDFGYAYDFGLASWAGRPDKDWKISHFFGSDRSYETVLSLGAQIYTGTEQMNQILYNYVIDYHGASNSLGRTSKGNYIAAHPLRDDLTKLFEDRADEDFMLLSHKKNSSMNVRYERNGQVQTDVKMGCHGLRSYDPQTGQGELGAIPGDYCVAEGPAIYEHIIRNGDEQRSCYIYTWSYNAFESPAYSMFYRSASSVRELALYNSTEAGGRDAWRNGGRGPIEPSRAVSHQSPQAEHQLTFNTWAELGGPHVAGGEIFAGPDGRPYLIAHLKLWSEGSLANNERRVVLKDLNIRCDQSCYCKIDPVGIKRQGHDEWDYLHANHGETPGEQPSGMSAGEIHFYTVRRP